MSLVDFEALVVKIHELEEDYRVFGINTKLLLEKTIDFNHFGSFSTMLPEETLFWKRISTDMFYKTIKYVWKEEEEEVVECEVEDEVEEKVEEKVEDDFFEDDFEDDFFEDDDFEDEDYVYEEEEDE